MSQNRSTLSQARPLLGTLVEITVRSPERSESSEAISRAFDTIQTIQRKLSFHDRASLLSEINSHAANRPVAIDPQTVRMLKIADELYTLTSGVFDVTIAPELERNGFLPIHNRINSCRYGSFADVEYNEEGFIRFKRPGIRIDLGGIAKGLAVSEAVAVLRAMGIKSGCVNAGGDLQAFGDESIPVQIRDPRHPGATLTTISIRNQAVASSAHYFADRIKPDARFGPFVDPRTRKLARSALSVTTVVRDAIYADALTKVVMIDPIHSLPLLARFEAAALMVDMEGSTVCTPNWYASVQAA
jgi:thiamine biosynthesis lipoprotein